MTPMSDRRIDRIVVKRTTDSGQVSIRAEAEVTVFGDAIQVVTSSGALCILSDSSAVYLRAMEDAQLSELRQRLYAAGFSKRAIATAVKDCRSTD